MLFILNTEPSERTLVRWISTTALKGALGTGVRKMFTWAEAGRTVAGMLSRRNREKAARENRIYALHRPDWPIAYYGARQFLNIALRLTPMAQVALGTA
jgi:hypothetical protein